MHYQQDDGGRSKSRCRVRAKEINDCVVRSISIATGQKYQKTFEDLMKTGLNMGAFPNLRQVYSRYLKSIDWVECRCPRNEAGRLVKLQDWDDANRTWKAPPARAVVLNSGHLTAVVDNTVHDTWDCRYRPVNTFWRKVTDDDYKGKMD